MTNNINTPCSQCGGDNGWHKTACPYHPRFITASTVELGIDSNFPLSETLRLLVEWMQHLHDSHECDCDGWEQRSFLIEAAQRYQRGIAASASTVAPQQSRPVCPECQQGYVCEHCGKPIGDYYAPAASTAALRDEISIEQAAKAVYRKYGVNLAGFWRDAFAAEAQKHGRTEVDQYGVDGNCIHCIPICRECRLNTIEAHLKEKDEIRAATTPPSTLARKAAEEIAANYEVHKDRCHSNERYPLPPCDCGAIEEIAAIIERCFSAENEK